MKHSISLIINGDPVDAIVKDNLTLLDFLRDQLFLTGTKKGCEEGECGACTVMLDGKPVNSCCTLAVECDGHEIITVEGIAREGMLHPIQKQFIEKWAMQCGYCTPGMIMSAKALLDVNKHPTELEIREAIEGRMKELAARRREKQPLEYPSAGSTFKRPQGYFAGKLIEDAGLRGYGMGGARVSEKHCGFVINGGNATASDVMALCGHIRKTVMEQSGVELEMEVKRWGEF